MSSKRTASARTARDPAEAGTDRIETPRLAGEPVSASHHGELCRLLGDPRVGRTLGGTRTPDEVAVWIAEEELHRAANGFGQWMWRVRSSGEFAGRGGLRRTEIDGVTETEAAWAVVPELWGRGYATEIGRASVACAFERLGLADLVAFTLPDNVASRRVMDKLGFEYEKDISHQGLPHVRYRLEAGR